MFRSYGASTSTWMRAALPQVARSFSNSQAPPLRICSKLFDKQLDNGLTAIRGTITRNFGHNNLPTLKNDTPFAANILQKYGNQKLNTNFAAIRRNFGQSTVSPQIPSPTSLIGNNLRKFGDKNLENRFITCTRNFGCSSDAMLTNKCKMFGQELSRSVTPFNGLIKRQFAGAKSVKMNFELFGEQYDKKDNPLLVMHGLLGSNRNWRSVSKALSEKLQKRVYNLDARNHGKSPHSKQHNAEYLTKDILQLTKEQGLNKINFLGHFMGGRAFLYFALKHPELVCRGVVVESTPFAKSIREMNDVFQTMRTLKIPKNLSMAEGRNFAAKELKPIIKDMESINYILTNLAKKPDGDFHWTVNVNVLQKTMRTFPDFLHQAGKINPYQGELMFVCGKISNCANKANWPGIKKVFPNADMQMIDAVHIQSMAKPEKFLDMVVNFLK